MELTLGVTPLHYCSGPGADLINSRLETFERVDASGHQSDQLTLQLNVEGIEGEPQEDAVIDWFEGYEETGAVRIGAFKISRITPRLFPRRLTIVCTAAPFGEKDETGFKERRTRSWDEATLGHVFSEVVTSHGLSPRIDPEIADIPLGHVDQTDETDAAFLSRLAAEHDAVAKPMDGMYVLALRGRTSSITGRTMEPVVISVPPVNKPGSRLFVNCETTAPKRQSAGGIIVQWQDDKTGEIHEIKSGAPPYKRMPTPFVSQEHAEQALKGGQRKNDREKSRMVLDIPGDATLAAEGLITTDDSWPKGMRGQMSIDRLVARGSRSGGYRMTIEATTPITNEKKPV